MQFSIIVPAYNRLDNLKLILAALHNQIDPPSFELVLADDGSTDGTRDFIPKHAVNYNFPITYQWCGPNLGFRTARTRNIGMAQAKGKWAICIDSDVLLNPHALQHHANLREVHPDILVVGMYHFASKATLDAKLVKNFANIESLVPNKITDGPPQPGLDCRIDDFYDNLDLENIVTEYDGLGFFGGNISWPIDLWWKLGGQDEWMGGGEGQGEDAEMGQRLRLNKVPVLLYKPIYGIHMWHARDMQKSQALVQKSIIYIDKKYGIGTYAEIIDPETDPREKDLSIWYTRDMKAILVKVEGDPTIFAYSESVRGYVGLPQPFWLELLDFTPSDVKTVLQEFLDEKTNYGVIRK